MTYLQQARSYLNSKERRKASGNSPCEMKTFRDHNQLPNPRPPVSMGKYKKS